MNIPVHIRVHIHIYIHMDHFQALAKNAESELLWLFYIFIFASCADTVRFRAGC